MYDDNNSFEQFPGSKNEVSAENLQRAETWEAAMSQDDVPEFAGDTFGPTEGIAPAEGIAPTEENASLETKNPEERENLSDAAAIINYGLNAAAKQYGVETVVQAIKNFDASASSSPVKDLFLALGVDTPYEAKEAKMGQTASKPEESYFYNSSPDAPATKSPSKEGAYKAINDMKELVLKVEGADPRYEEIRNGARSAGKGYFEYAAGGSTNRSLVDLFNALAAVPKVEQPEQPEQPEETSEDSEETVV